MKAIEIAALERERGPVTVVLKGEPVAKGRGRAFAPPGGRPFIYTPKKTATYEAAFKAVASEVMRDRPPINCAVRMELVCILPIADSWSGVQKRRALDGTLLPTGRPDLDNVEKAATDALNHVVFRDDSLICEKVSRKIYGAEPQVRVTVTPL